MKKITDINLSGMDIIFEITRNCNMLCPHCIRGDRQRLKIKKEYIDSLFSQINSINTIMFSGGEPALANDIIEYALESANRHNVGIDNFWMATNGTVTKKSFFKNIENWLNYCDDNEISGLRVSIDPYHDKIDSEWKFKGFAESINYYFENFYLELTGAPEDSKNLISEGRAKENYYCTREISHDVLLEDNNIIGSLYINAKGFIISTCDISYETMDNNKDFTICHVTDNIKEKLIEWFNNHPDLVEQS